MNQRRPIGRFECLEDRLALTVPYMFVDSGQLIGESSARQVALGDLDNDGDLDAFIGHLGTVQEVPRDWPDEVWLNDGTGRFTNTGQRIGHRQTLDVELGDLDGDGDLDVFTAHGLNQIATDVDELDSIWLNDGHGNFTERIPVPGRQFSLTVALGDLDDDDDLDAIVTGAGNNHVLLNDGSGNMISSQSLGQPISVGAAFGDVDDDEDLDIFFTRFDKPDQVWLNDGTGYFVDSGQRIGSGETQFVAVGDLDNDGDVDAMTSGSGSRLSLWSNDGRGVFSLDTAANILGISREIILVDVDTDGDLDVFSGAWSCNTGEGVFRSCLQPLVVGPRRWSIPWGVAIGDLDNDTDLDIFAAGTSNGEHGKVLFSRLIGDANDDGRFDSSDLVRVFQAAKYEDNIPTNAMFDEGDWNQDGDFDSRDLTFALQFGHFETDVKPLAGDLEASIHGLSSQQWRST